MQPNHLNTSEACCQTKLPTSPLVATFRRQFDSQFNFPHFHGFSQISDLNIRNDYFGRNIELSKFKVSVKMAEAKKSDGENAFAQFMSEVGPGVGETDIGWIVASNDAANRTRRLVSLH